jgi:hypothetical protein
MMTTQSSKQPVKRILLWTPRVLSLLFALFVSLFALDVFGQGYGFWQTTLALLSAWPLLGGGHGWVR